MVGAMGADIAMRDAARRARYGRRGWPGRVNKPSRRSGRDARTTQEDGCVRLRLLMSCGGAGGRRAREAAREKG